MVKEWKCFCHFTVYLLFGYFCVVCITMDDIFFGRKSYKPCENAVKSHTSMPFVTDWNLILSLRPYV